MFTITLTTTTMLCVLGVTSMSHVYEGAEGYAQLNYKTG